MFGRYPSKKRPGSGYPLQLAAKNASNFAPIPNAKAEPLRT